MSDIYKIFKRLLSPPRWFIVLSVFLCLFFCAAAIILAVVSPENQIVRILSYVVYAFAAITLGYIVTLFVLHAPAFKSAVIGRVKSTDIGERMLEHYGFRTLVFAGVATIINIAYVIMHIFLAFTTDNFFWYGSLALYYAALVALRGGIVLYTRRKSKVAQEDNIELLASVSKYRSCGIVLTVLPLSLAVPILQIIFLGKAFIHEGWSVLAFAAYAFYKIIMAIINVVKSQKATDYTVRAVRCVGLADAMMSVFSLQTALLFAFADGNYSLFNAVVGVIVCVLTVALGVFMIKSGNKKMKELREENRYGR